mmetsp:Transcript_13928/g.44649  ORF Transcript_13928/g.44649 Transcript_13928/m.44649 type:complete len:212 (+) Transcript_13928:119-754(+)
MSTARPISVTALCSRVGSMRMTSNSSSMHVHASSSRPALSAMEIVSSMGFVTPAIACRSDGSSAVMNDTDALTAATRIERSACARQAESMPPSASRWARMVAGAYMQSSETRKSPETRCAGALDGSALRKAFSTRPGHGSLLAAIAATQWQTLRRMWFTCSAPIAAMMCSRSAALISSGSFGQSWEVGSSIPRRRTAAIVLVLTSGHIRSA